MSKKNEEIEQVQEVEAAAAETTTLKPQSMDDLTGGEVLPEVQEHSINAVQADAMAKTEAAKGEGFDPEIHAKNTDGSPKKTAAGNFAKKRGRKSVLNTGGKTAKQEKIEIEEEKAALENHQSAKVVSMILEQAQMKMISGEFEYSDKERAANQAVWEATFEYYGNVNIPPPIALAVDHLTIILSRTQKPETKDKLSHVKLWFKNKFKRNKKHALPDSGKNSKREDNIRKEESA